MYRNVEERAQAVMDRLAAAHALKEKSEKPLTIVKKRKTAEDKEDA